MRLDTLNAFFGVCVALSLALGNAFGTLSMSGAVARHILFDVPVSNNGARCRIITYKKELPESEVIVMSPTEVGGMKSKDYMAISPQGKVPALKCTTNGLCIAESDTVSRYLISTYADIGPSFQPDNPISNMIARLHDIYLQSIQNCLYKPAPPFGIYGTRKDALEEFSKQLYIIADLISDSGGMYLCGDEVSLADATLFPTMVFATYMFPKFDVDIDTPIPEKISYWFESLLANDAAFKVVYDEMMQGIAKWEDGGRWDPIWLAGKRDDEPETLFDKILNGEIPSTVVKEDDKILAFKDINPAAPAHVLVIPKYRNGLTRLSKATMDQSEILGRLLVAAAEIARDESLGFGTDGTRIVINDGKNAGQEVFHLHVHVLGGRDFTWPPG